MHLSVHAAGVNFADLLMRTGLYGTVPPRPFSPGFEVSGIIERVGGAVEGWAPGDHAVALLRYGGYAQDVIVPERQIFRVPPSLDHVQAAAIPVVFLTAWICLFETGHARAGETALVLGAGGGVGTALVQLAVHRGLRVIGTAGSERKRRYVTEELGAAFCFDSRGEWAPEVERVAGERGVDIALDPVGGAATKQCRALLAPLGRLVFYGLSEALPGIRRNWIRAALAWLSTPRIHPLDLVIPNTGVFGVHLLHLQRKEEVLRPALERIYAGVLNGSWRPIVDRTFPLTRDGAVEAHRHLHGRANLGKVVLTK